MRSRADESAHPARATRAFCPTEDISSGQMLLEASAGTGKTYAVTSRVLWLVAEHGIPLPRLLVVTFTRAAASELRERIRTRLAGAARALAAAARGEASRGEASLAAAHDDVVAAIIDAADGDRGRLAERARALRQAGEQLDEATISTIHGFCQRMLTASALETGVDFDAELVEDEGTLRGEVVDDLAARWLRPAPLEWVAYLRDVGRIAHETLDRVTELASGGERPALRPEPGSLDHADGAARWHEECARFREVWEAHRDTLEEKLTALKDAKEITGWNSGRIQEEFTRIDAWLATGPPLPSHDGWAKGAGLEWLAGRRKPGGTHDLPPAITAAENLMQAATLMASHWLSAFAATAPTTLDARKRRLRTIGFDDQLRRLADALTDAELGETTVQAVRQRYDAALIDEFQDTDPLQWRIFSTAFADRGLVLIGDPKQAIYSFRGADLPTYLRAATEIPREAHRGLEVNWRSDQRYLDAVNAIFSTPGAFADERIPPRAVTAAPHLQRDRLTWPDDAPRASLRIRYVRGEAAAAEGGLDQRQQRWILKAWANRRLPDDVAAQVRGLLDDPPTVTDGDQPRPLSASDVAVLVRTNRHARLVQRGLRAAGLPATIARADSVFTSVEADELLRLLDAVAEPTREALARAAAATRLFGWTAGDLLDPAREAEWHAWAERRQRWHRLWHERGITPLLRTVFNEESTAPRLLAMDGGERAVTNLTHLAERLHTAERAERLGPAALTDWLRAARAEAASQGDRQAPEDAELRLERDDEAVQIVTVHASKGLQYPVVLCPYLWDAPAPKPQRGDLVLFHDEDSSERRTLDVYRGDGASERHRSVEMSARQRHAESLRLAYVALTRAQHHAVVWWGRFSGAEHSAPAWLWHRQHVTDSDEATDIPWHDRTRAISALRDVFAQGDDPLLADLADLAEGVGGDPAPAIALEEVSAPPEPLATAPPRASAPRDPLRARVFSRDLDRAWRRASFTQLARHAHDGVPPSGETGRDDDEGGPLASGYATSADPDAGDPARAAIELPLAHVPRGADFGDAVHRILERTDFRAAHDAPDGLATVVADETARAPALEARHEQPLVAGLSRTLATPLGNDLGGLALGDLSRADRLDELEFELPLAGGHTPVGDVSLGALADCLRGHPDGHDAADSVARLGRGQPVHGFLTGSIDLLARLRADGLRADGLRTSEQARYLVIDYKTNWLGEAADRDRDPDEVDRSTAWHYRPDALERAMHDHAYHLQAVLYLVAAHRYLRSRLGGTYDAERDLAGAAYLFVRGMHGPAAQRDDGTVDGVWRWTPSATLIDDVDDLLATGRPRP